MKQLGDTGVLRGGSGGSGGPITAASITDASASGRTVLTGTAAEGRSALGITPSEAGSQTTYFVDSVSGDDSNNGATSSTPLKTLAALVTRAGSIPDGSTIYLKSGSLWREGCALPNLDRASVIAYGVGDYPTIDGSGLLDNATFTQNATYSTVYQQPWLQPIIEGSSVYRAGAWEGTTWLKPLTSISAVSESAIGGWYCDGTNIYVKASDGSDPRANGRVYCASKRNVSGELELGDNATVIGIRFRRPLLNDGGLRTLLKARVDGCVFEYGNKHNMVIGSGTVHQCIFDYPPDHTWSDGGSDIGFYFNHDNTEEYLVDSCEFRRGEYGRDACILAHTSGLGEFVKGTVQFSRFFGRITNTDGLFTNAVGVLPRNTFLLNNYFEDIGVVWSSANSSGPYTLVSNGNRFIDKVLTSGHGNHFKYQLATSSSIVKSTGDTYISRRTSSASAFIFIHNRITSFLVDVNTLYVDRGLGNTDVAPVIYCGGGSMTGEIRLTKSRFNDWRVISLNDGSSSNTITYIGEDNNFLAGSQFQAGDNTIYTGLAAWSVASGTDTTSKVAPNIIRKSVSVTINNINALGSWDAWVELGAGNPNDFFSAAITDDYPAGIVVAHCRSTGSANWISLKLNNVTNSAITFGTHTVVVLITQTD